MRVSSDRAENSKKCDLKNLPSRHRPVPHAVQRSPLVGVAILDGLCDCDDVLPKRPAQAHQKWERCKRVPSRSPRPDTRRGAPERRNDRRLGRDLVKRPNIAFGGCSVNVHSDGTKEFESSPFMRAVACIMAEQLLRESLVTRDDLSDHDPDFSIFGQQLGFLGPRRILLDLHLDGDQVASAMASHVEVEATADDDLEYLFTFPLKYPHRICPGCAGSSARPGRPKLKPRSRRRAGGACLLLHSMKKIRPARGDAAAQSAQAAIGRTSTHPQIREIFARYQRRAGVPRSL